MGSAVKLRTDYSASELRWLARASKDIQQGSQLFSRPSDESRMINFEWMPIRHRNVISVPKNPFYAGVHVHGKSEKRTEIVEGRARKSYGHGKLIGTWEVKPA